MKKAKLPKFCNKCGQKLLKTIDEYKFNSVTGKKEVAEISLTCPTNEHGHFLKEYCFEDGETEIRNIELAVWKLGEKAEKESREYYGSFNMY